MDNLPWNTGCRRGWSAVRASACWLSHLSWLSQQDVTAAFSVLPADHWAWDPLRSPALSQYLYPHFILASTSLQRECESRALCQRGGMKANSFWLHACKERFRLLTLVCWFLKTVCSLTTVMNPQFISMCLIRHPWLYKTLTKVGFWLVFYCCFFPVPSCTHHILTEDIIVWNYLEKQSCFSNIFTCCHFTTHLVEKWDFNNT